MSTAKLVGHQEQKKKGSIGRGRGRRSDPQKQAAQIQDVTCGSKRECSSKTPDKTLTTRASRGRGWKRPDQAIYVPRALRKKENIDSQSTEDCRGEDKACQLTKKDEDIFTDSDSFQEQESADSHYLARQYPEKDKTAVSVPSSKNQNCYGISDERRTEAPVNGLSELSTTSDLFSNEAVLFDITPKSVSDLYQDSHKQTETFLSTEDYTSRKCYPEKIEKEVVQELQKSEDKTQMGSAGGVEIRVIDRCLSKPLVTPHAENERNEQKEQSLLENQDVRESTNIDQQKPVVDTRQSKLSVECVDVEDDKDNEKALKCQDMQKNVIGADKQQCLTSSAILVPDKPVAEGDDARKEEAEFLEEFGKGLVEIEIKGEEKQSQVTDASQSSSMNDEIPDNCDVYPQESMCMTISEDAADVETDSKDEICYQKCTKETSSNVSNNILMDFKNVSHEILNNHPAQNHQLGENSYSYEVKEVTSDERDSSEKNKSPSQNEEDERESDNLTNIEIQGSSNESEQRKNVSDLDVGTKEEQKVDLDDVVNNEKSDEKETKHKKRSKKKKGEENPKEGKKNKKSKKKESEYEESKEKENDEKHKLKKKEKKKANKEDSGTKSKESKSKEKAKEKKEEKCKKGNEGNEEDDESWEFKFDEDGECLDPDLLEELTEATGIKKPSKRKTQFDYYALPSKEVTLDDDSGYGHIVELYDFSPELKTQDLVQLLSSFKNQGYDIKWVDDTHALAVFSSEIAAKQAIQMCSSPIMKLRPVSQGTPESKSKAKNCFDFLQPYKPRPQTTNLAAHRLVTGALGVRSTMSKEEREREREKIKEAKEQKRQEKQRKADIWGD